MKKESLRKAYGNTLVKLGATYLDIVALEADLGKSTMSYLFKEAYPERFFEMGIAEQNMMSTAAGLALAGKIPFVSTFAVFASGRAFDQIRCSIAIAEANVKICGSSCGLSDFGDGKTHQSVEDANIIRAMPNMTVLNPVDAVETRHMVEAMVRYKGPVYIRINRNELPVITPEDQPFEIGKMYSVHGGKDAVIFATGAMVHNSIAAAYDLLKEGISVEVVNVSTLKPLHKEELMRFARGKQAIVTAEEANRIGGMGDTIASLLFNDIRVPMEHVAIDDQFGTSAYAYEELLIYYKLTKEDIAKAVKKALQHF
ncbi:MAG: transketolase family protein [Lentisphaerae bacterium]|nr:transketolase family protein [Lentisphaerota bacterium]